MTASLDDEPDLLPSEAGVLVIDDEREVLDTMVAMLESEGYRVCLARDGGEATRLMTVVRFDVIVSDLMMPNLDGLQLLDVAKAYNPAVEVLLVTGFGSRDTAREAWRKGACGFLEKPFSSEQISGAVRQALWRSRLRRTAHTRRNESDVLN